MTFEKRVCERELHFNDIDENIIAYIRAHRTDLPALTLDELALETYTCPFTIIKTAKKIGYSGFSELKYALLCEDNPADVKTAEHRLSQVLPQGVLQSLDLIETKTLHTLVQTVIRAKKILVIGCDENNYFSHLLCTYLRCLDKPLQQFHNLHDTQYMARNYTKEDLMLFVCDEEVSNEVLAIAKTAKTKEIPSFCLTHYEENTLRHYCDARLCFGGEKRNINGYNLTDKSGLMILVRRIGEEFWKQFPTQ